MDDSDSLPAAGRQAPDVIRVACENPVARTGYQHDCRVDGVIRTGLAEQRSCIASQLFVDRTYIHCPQQSCDPRLLAAWIAPDLRDYDSAGAQLVPVELCDAQPRHH